MKKADNRLLLQVCKIITKNKEIDLKKTLLLIHLQQTKPGNANLPIGSSPQSLGAPTPTSAFSNQPLAGTANLPIGSSLSLSSLPLAAQPLSSVLDARVAKLEKTLGPQSDAAVAEIAESILAEARKSVKRSA
jgi:hypothetical protein